MEKAKGSALLSALFIMTLVAIAATAMTLRMHLDIYRTTLTISSDKRYLASQAVLFWAMDELTKKYSFYKVLSQGQVMDFPKNMQNIYPGFIVNGQLFDVQARFNVNNLSDKIYRTRFNALLEQVLPKKNSQEREALLNNILYWISSYDLNAGMDNELGYYLKQSPPYYPSRLPFKNITELRLVNGVDANVYQALSPVLTVLPKNLPVNINTATKPVLFSLQQGITAEQVNEIIEARKDQGIVDQNALNTLLTKLNIPANSVTIESEYFLVKIEVKNEDYQLISFSLLQREKQKDGKVLVYLIEEGY